MTACSTLDEFASALARRQIPLDALLASTRGQSGYAQASAKFIPSLGQKRRQGDGSTTVKPVVLMQIKATIGTETQSSIAYCRRPGNADHRDRSGDVKFSC